MKNTAKNVIAYFTGVEKRLTHHNKYGIVWKYQT